MESVRASLPPVMRQERLRRALRGTLAVMTFAMVLLSLFALLAIAP